MPEALATTKRKFHKLLDSRFGSPSAPAPRPISQVSQVTVAEPAAKRIRSGGSTTSLATSLRHRNVSATSFRSMKPVKEPVFAPWSHDAFVKRLHTFSPVTLWQPKPDQVNEVQWAKRGWSCVDSNTVACKGACEQRVVVNVDPISKRPRSSDQASQDTDHEDQDDEEELERALIEKYKELIIDGHSDSCLWRQAGCKDDIYRLPIVKSSVWQPQLSQRFNSLSPISSSLTSLVLQPDDLSPSPQSLFTDLPPSLLSPTEDGPTKESSVATEARPKALTIALCGWRGATEASTQLLVCDACFQRIGLWMYQPDYKPHAFADDEDDDTTDRSLDLIQLHRDHCPWRNPESQAATGNYAGQPAYKILLDVLERFVDEHKRRAKHASVPVVTTEVGSERGVSEDGRDSLVLEHMPDLTRQETDKADKERLSKLRRLRTVLGFKKRAPPTV